MEIAESLVGSKRITASRPVMGTFVLMFKSTVNSCWSKIALVVAIKFMVANGAVGGVGVGDGDGDGTIVGAGVGVGEGVAGGKTVIAAGVLVMAISDPLG